MELHSPAFEAGAEIRVRHTCEGCGGLCPPIGRHRYVFELYALDTLLPALARPKRADVERAMHGHVRARAELVGTYRKRRP